MIALAIKSGSVENFVKIQAPSNVANREECHFEIFEGVVSKKDNKYY